MARVTREQFLPDATPPQAVGILSSWLTARGFRILSFAADGSTNLYPAPEVTLPSNPGQAVLNVTASRGDVIGLNTAYGPRAPGWPFIAVLRAQPRVQGGKSGLAITAEFFFATIAGVGSLGVKEWTPAASIWGVGGAVRIKAWPIIEAFDADFASGRVWQLPIPPIDPVPPTRGVIPDSQRLPTTPLPPPPAADGSLLQAKVRRTSVLQSANLFVGAATQFYLFMAILLLIVLVPVSGLVIYILLLSRFAPWTLDVATLAIVGATVLLAYSVYIALYRVRAPLARGEVAGIANRALFLGLGAIGIGLVLGVAINWFAAIFCIPGALYVAAYLRLRGLSTN